MPRFLSWVDKQRSSLLSNCIRPFLITFLVITLAACSIVDHDQAVPAPNETIATPVELVIALVETPTTTPAPPKKVPPTETPPPTQTPTATATPMIIPANFRVQNLSTWGSGPREAVIIQHPHLGQIFVLDDLRLETLFQISWTDDNPQTAVLRFRNEDDIIVEHTASIDPDRGEISIEQEPGENDQTIPRHQFPLNTADVFPVFTQIERLATIELADEDGNIQPFQILFSRHDYGESYTNPIELAQPQYDQFELGIDWRSERYAPQGALADWLNSRPELWNRVTIAIEGREPLTWSAIREDETLLHQELAAAAYEDEIVFYYLTADGRSQLFARDRVPFYTKFALVHSPSDKREFYTLRAGRDPGVSEEMLQEMAEVVRHMFTHRPNYLHELALNNAVHSVAPGKNMLVLPELSILPDEIVDVIIDGEDFGAATGIALLQRHEEISASAGHYFENDAPILGFTLIHEIVHQVQYMIYGSSWSQAVGQYYTNYIALPRNQRIPDIDYYETLPWEWDAFITTAWFAQGSPLYDHVDPYLDLQVSSTGTTIREHLQRRWGDPLPAYESQ